MTICCVEFPMSRLTLLMLGVLMLSNVPAFACGQERWAVKTLTDAQHGQIKHLAQAITIGDLIDLPKTEEHDHSRLLLTCGERQPFLRDLAYRFLTLMLKCGIGRAAKRRWQGLASQRVHRADQATRALSVAIPVSAYICR